MTCEECEIKLGMGEDAGEHIASCDACRQLAEDLRLNAMALGEMRVRTPVRWEWTLAAAAAITMAIGTRAMIPEQQFTAPPVRVAALAPRIELPPPMKHVKHTRPHVTRPQPEEPLRVKMLTSDPDVVIYWIVDRKEGFE